MNLRYRVELTQSKRGELEGLLRGGKHPVRKLKRAQILLAADAGAGDEQIACTVAVSLDTGVVGGGDGETDRARQYLPGNHPAAAGGE
jgi:hypothetical protein